ncbi:MAG: hypothetical protein IH582_05880, partial [Afipia sp.]|nr:hypothetical protein [Afipia sp.]
MNFVQAVSAMFRRLKPFVLLFLIAQFLVRLTLTVVSAKDLSLAPQDWLIPFLTGLWFDLVTLLPIVATMLLFPLLLPVSFAGKRFDRAVGLSAFAIALFLLAVQAVGEYLFWDEFTTRFNFIAVDYLVYTQEVLQNIMESYPVYPLLAVIGLLAVSGTYVLRRQVTAGFAQHPPFLQRAGVFAATTLLATVALFMAPVSMTNPTPNAIARELGGNGLYGLVNAFFANEIDFASFYRTIPEKEAALRARSVLSEPHEPYESANPNDITRNIRSDGPMMRKNVILVTMDTTRADHLPAYGYTGVATPALDALARQ